MTSCNGSGLERVSHASLDNLLNALTYQDDQYSRCISLMNSIEFEEEPIWGFFFDLCGQEVSIDSLRQQFSRQEISEINAILEWYYVVLMGCFPACNGGKTDFVLIKKFLGAAHLVEVLSPSVTLVSTENTLSFQDVLKIVGSSKSSLTDNYSRFLETIKEAFSHNASIAMIEANIDLSIDHEIALDFSERLQTVGVNERIRWALFTSIVDKYCNESELVVELQTQAASTLPSDIRQEMQPLLKRLCDALAMPNKKRGNAHTGIAGGAQVNPFMPQRTFAKMDVPGLPNWMPNGGDSCYISATIWPIFLLLHAKVQEKISKFEPDSPYYTSAEKRAWKAFTNLYAQVAAKESVHILTGEVNEFRKAMQEAFPERFIDRYGPSQEDAYYFLSAVLSNLLGIDCCNESVSKFLVLHTFTRLNNEPLKDVELYDYRTALDPSYNAQLSYILDINLDVKAEGFTTFGDFVTRSRVNGESERTAKILKPITELQKNQSVLETQSVPETQIVPEIQIVPILHTEQFFVESPELAPDFFCGRITRFSFNHTTGDHKKRADLVYPVASLDFHVKDSPNETVPYDLVAITVHSGLSVNAGHYYTYFRLQKDGVWQTFKYDDVHGPELCVNEQQVLQDAAVNGYIHYYKKRPGDAVIPPEFVVKKSSAVDSTHEWLTNNVKGLFVVDEQKGAYPAIKDLEAESLSFVELAAQLNQAIYLVDPNGDKGDLTVLDDGYPIPGDLFRFGEEHASNGVVYIFKQQDASFVSLKQCQTALQ